MLWGESSMIQAERLLLDAALEDPANQRFVLLSDRLLLLMSCMNELFIPTAKCNCLVYTRSMKFQVLVYLK